MTELDEISNKFHLLIEEKNWKEALDYLSEHWFLLRGTTNIELSAAIGKILIFNGYSEWAKNWLFERILYHPRNGTLMRWLVESAAELRDHEEMRQFGELHEEANKVSVVPTEHLMNALLALGSTKRFLEIYERHKNSLKPKGHRMYSQYTFYELQDFDNSAKIHLNLPKECNRWEDFTSHGALSLYRNGETEKALQLMQLHLDQHKANSAITAYEMFRQSEPSRALDFLNNSLTKYGYAPLSNRWMNQSFDLMHLCCDDVQHSTDSRLVSVLMTVHAMNPLFKTAVRSILEQSHQNLELLVIDDASSEEDHQEYKRILESDGRARLIRQPYNAGTYSARNTGLKEAKGEFVLFMDSDDWTHPQRIEKALQRLDQHPSAVVAVESYARLHRNGSLAMVGSYFVRKCMLGLWRMHAVRDKLGGFDSVRISADSELLERAELVYGKGSVHHVPALVYIAYYHDESLTGGDEFGFGWRGIVGHRAKYAGAFRTWHRREHAFLNGYNMMEMSKIEQPFKLPSGFHRTSLTHLPYRRIPSNLEPMRADCATNALSGFFHIPKLSNPPTEFPISVCMATYPARFKTVGRTVATLLNQTTPPSEIHLWVNESDNPPPLPDDSRIVVHLAPENNLTDIGKFAAASLAPEGIIILADDDLNYPPDYVERMVIETTRFDGRACVGLHGVVLPLGREINKIEEYFNMRRVHLYRRGLSIHLPCHVIGTGTMAYDSRKIKFDYTRWSQQRMVDLHVGVECQRLGIGMVTIPREQGWLSPFEPEEDDESIWEHVKRDTTLQKEMMEVVSQVKDWNFILHDGTRITEQDLLQSIDVSIEKTTSVQTQIKEVVVSDSYDVTKRWRQRGRILTFDGITRTVRYTMPLGWRIEDTHRDLFRLTHYLLTSPWEKGILQGWHPTRKKAWRPALAYSAGVDSHACLELMPKNTLIMYHERDGFESKLNHENANVMLKTLEASGRHVVCIPSNHELLRTDRGKGPGFSTDLAVGSMAILLADFYGLSGVAFGMPLENSYLFHGHSGRDFLKSQYWIHHKSIFEKAGLDLILPSAGLSEIINLKIVEDSELGHLAESCLRAKKAGTVCGECWKCFRKNSLRGEPVVFSKEADTFLQKQPLKQAASTIYALQKIGLKNANLLEKYTHLKSILQIDVNWLLRYHPDSAEYIPTEMRTYFLNKLKTHATVMTGEERNIVETLKLYS
ncbi:MAG: glycosyltransferase [Candidatus Poseidoniales archaeon]